MISNDKLEKDRANAKNAVEEYVYEMRDKLSSEYEPYVKPEVSFNSFHGIRHFSNPTLRAI